MPADLFKGVLAPVLTPFGRDLAPDPARFTAFCRWLLDEGVHGLAVFGTTSEANSMSVAERKRLLEELVESDVAPHLLMPGTGACSITDAVDLTGHAVRLGCGGALVLPPFYYKNQSDDGLFAYFAEVIERVGDAALKVYLYHFPQMSAAPISPALIARLRQRYPDTVVGIKDSSGEWEATKRLVAEFPDFAVFPSSEVRLNEGLALGMAGCISATANIQPRAIRTLFDRHATPDAPAWHERITTVRRIVERYPPIAPLKALVARDSGDADWGITRPPIRPLSEEQRAKLFQELEESGCFDAITAVPA